MCTSPGFFFNLQELTTLLLETLPDIHIHLFGPDLQEIQIGLRIFSGEANMSPVLISNRSK